LKKAAALCLLLVGCGSSGEETNDEIRIGLLLPYTGKDGSAGANYERGVLMAAELVNEAGGLYGRPLRILFADTHSSFDRGLSGSRSLVDQGVVAIIGPEDDELARTLAPELDTAGVALLTPSSSSVAVDEDANASLWFRLAPSGKALGIALGRHMKSNGAARVAIVSTAAEYELSFATGVEERLSDSGVQTRASAVINSGASNFSRTIATVLEAAPDSIVLAADASTGSRFVNEFASVAGLTGIRWYLSPTLEQEAFVLNSFPEVVEGMVGVAAAVSDNEDQTAAFNDTFLERWKGSTPTTGAFFYYDALAVFAIAYEGAASASGSPWPASEAVREHILSVSGQSGLVVEWNELGKGITQAHEGTGVYYSGLTGVISLDESGARSAAYTRLWNITSGRITQLPR
jgi:branched-chain amino acid transport system substrate-binding protein